MSSSGAGQNPAALAPVVAPPPPPPPPIKYKIEYMPMRRDMRSFGGWDLDAIEAELGPLVSGKGRPRSVRELGECIFEPIAVANQK